MTKLNFSMQGLLTGLGVMGVCALAAPQAHAAFTDNT